MSRYIKGPKYDIGDRFKAVNGDKWKTITAVYEIGNRVKYCIDGHYSDLINESELNKGLKQKRIIYKAFR